jgi:hypothetical protein
MDEIITINKTVTYDSFVIADSNIANLLKKPASGGIPAIENKTRLKLIIKV